VRNRGRRGISTVIGTAIAAAIVLTCLVPVLLHVQLTTDLLNHEVNLMRRLDEDRYNEEMQATAFIGEDLDIYLNMTEASYLPLEVVRIWIMVNDSTEVRQDVSLTLSLGDPSLTYNTGIRSELRKAYQFKIVSARGNIYVPTPNPLTFQPPYQPPQGSWVYMLAVTVQDTHSGCTYTIYADEQERYSQHISAGNEQAITIVLGWNEPGTHWIRIVSSKDKGGSSVLFDAAVQVPPSQAIIVYG